MTKEFIRKPTIFPLETELPWNIVDNLCTIISHIIETLDDSYKVNDGVAVHETATIDHNVTIKAPAIISADCFVGSNSYLRGGVFLAPGAKVGISCEVKTSVLLEGCAIAHFNFVGDSIIGHDVNIEAGANAFQRDQPNAETHFVPSGHFALESHHTEIARLIKEFLKRVL